jgi:hypothetical protein
MTGDDFAAAVVVVVVVVAMMGTEGKDKRERGKGGKGEAGSLQTLVRFSVKGGEVIVERYTTTGPKRKRPGIRFNNATG